MRYRYRYGTEYVGGRRVYRRGGRRRMGALPTVLLLLAALLAALLMWWQPHGDAPPSEPVVLTVPLLLPDGTVQSMDIEELLCGVVAAEMPADFAPEALRAQAVAARSYILRHAAADSHKHGEAAVCCDPSCCQAWLSEQELHERWGSDYRRCCARIAAAVRDTAGEVLCYGGSIAETPFCSTCGGCSESAAACWGGDVPYLGIQTCGYCVHSPRYLSQTVYTQEQAALLLDTERDGLCRMSCTQRDASGRALELELPMADGCLRLSGTELRQRLALPSTAVQWLLRGDEVVFFCLGYGHGVGLCQYGADGMARAGCDHRTILARYYPSTELKSDYAGLVPAALGE